VTVVHNWLYGLAALLALTALLLRVYQWQSGEARFDFIAIVVPGLFALGLGYLWLRGRRGRKAGQ
jgi:hypothetical protein